MLFNVYDFLFKYILIHECQHKSKRANTNQHESTRVNTTQHESDTTQNESNTS